MKENIFEYCPPRVRTDAGERLRRSDAKQPRQLREVAAAWVMKLPRRHPLAIASQHTAQLGHGEGAAMLLHQPGKAQDATAVAFPADHLQPIRSLRSLGEGDNGTHAAPFSCPRCDAICSSVLTHNPHIVIARPPRRIRKAAEPAKPAAVIVGRKVAPGIPEQERDHARAEPTPA
jgi:hypothetical protein